jgi:hypothetical protein
VADASSVRFSLSPDQDRSKPILFSMARLDRVKNLTSLAEWYGRSERLRNLVNLVIVGGIVDPDVTSDRFECVCLSVSQLASQPGSQSVR